MNPVRILAAFAVGPPIGVIFGGLVMRWLVPVSVTPGSHPVFAMLIGWVLFSLVGLPALSHFRERGLPGALWWLFLLAVTSLMTLYILFFISSRWTESPFVWPTIPEVVFASVAALATGLTALAIAD
jgi:hypothetical protein